MPCLFASSVTVSTWLFFAALLLLTYSFWEVFVCVHSLTGLWQQVDSHMLQGILWVQSRNMLHPRASLSALVRAQECAGADLGDILHSGQTRGCQAFGGGYLPPCDSREGNREWSEPSSRPSRPEPLGRYTSAGVFAPRGAEAWQGDNLAALHSWLVLSWEVA